MGHIGKTRVPYQGALPTGAGTVTLFDSTVAFGPKCMHLMAPMYWAEIGISINQNATGNSVTGDFSNDGGVTWTNFYTSTSGTPTTGTAFAEEVFIGQYQDVRFRFVNGTNAQTVFLVNFNLSSHERSAANHAKPLL